MNTRFTCNRFSSLIFSVALLVSAGATPTSAFAAPAPTVGTAASATFLVYNWAKTWGGSGYAQVDRLTTDGSGNIFASGEYSGTVDFDPDPVKTDFHTSFNNTIDAFVSKFDANGQFLWARTWGGQDRDVAYGVGADSAGNAYVVGPYRYTVNFNTNPGGNDTRTSNYPGENNIYVSKFSADGTFQWVRTWGPAKVPGRITFGGEAYSVAVCGNYLYIAGDFSGGTTDFDPWGAPDLHTNHLPPPGTEPCFFDAWLSKLDLNGNFQWARTWGGTQYDDGPGVAVDSQGNAYVAGMYGSTDINFDPAGGAAGLGHGASESSSQRLDVFLTKFDASGHFQWVRTWGEAGTEEAAGMVAVDSANNVYIAGRYGCKGCNFDATHATQDIRTSNGDLDVFVSKYTSSGAYAWTRTWGGAGRDQPSGLVVDKSDNVWVSGWFQNTVDFAPASGGDGRTSHGGNDVSLSAFDSGGNLEWVGTWGGSGDDSGSVAVDSLGRVYIAGGFASTVDFDPTGGVDNHTAAGQEDAYLGKLAVAGPVITPAGGTVSLTTVGPTTLSFPAGAVSSPITLTEGVTNTLPLSAGQRELGPAFYIEAVDSLGTPVTTFSTDYTVTVHYTDAQAIGIYENTLQLCYWDAQANAWQPISTTVDLAGNQLTADLNHLSTFAVMGSLYPLVQVYLPLIVH